ncbi:MAG TPA: hypothetical protein VGF25_09730 [Thermoleophilaceae bacterium]|jgi:hypothetical protein
MTAAALAAPLQGLAERRAGGWHGDRARGRGRGLTLAERLDGIWAAVRADGEAECPICRGRMQLRHGQGECAGCGSRMS